MRQLFAFEGITRRIVCTLVFCLLSLAGLLRAQSDPGYVIYNGVVYLAHHYNTDVHSWEVVARNSFDTTCIWYSPTGDLSCNNYYWVDTYNPTHLYLQATWGAYNGTTDGIISMGVRDPSDPALNNPEGRFYFYDWDKGLARGRKICESCDGLDPLVCPASYHNTSSTECWECYWVVYDGAANKWHMSTEAAYDRDYFSASSAIFRRIRVNDHPVTINDSTGGAGTLSPITIDYAGVEYPTITITDPLEGHATPAYTTYSISDLECHGNWPLEYCDTTWTIHNYFRQGDETSASDHLTATPTMVNIPSYSGVAYLWSVSGDGASHLTLTNPTTASPTLTYSTPNYDGVKEATLTVTITYTPTNPSDITVTQIRSAIVTVNPTCGPPATRVASIDYDGVTVSWSPLSNDADASDNRYYIEYQKKSGDEWPDVWSGPIGVGDVSSYTLRGLDYSSNYRYKVAAVCSGVVDPVYGDPVEFTTKTTPKLVIGGSVFGGGRMADVTGSTTVIIANADTIGAVYGGNDIAGEVQGADGSTIHLGVNTDQFTGNPYGVTASDIHIGSVYGGGNGFYTYYKSSDDDKYISPFDMSDGKPVIGNASHGSATEYSKVIPVVATSAEISTPAIMTGTVKVPTIVKTAISVNNDYVKVDSLFGGAKNAFVTKSGAGNTSTDIDILGGTVFALFGGNNYGGAIGSNSTQDIDISMTTTTNTANVSNTYSTGFGRNYGIRYLFGGGNKVEGQKVDISMVGGQVDTLFAGGNRASVAACTVTVNCPKTNFITNNAVYSWDGDDVQSINSEYAWDTKGVYNIRTLFGGNNNAAMSVVPTLTLTSGHVGTVYGGGNAGDMTGYLTHAAIDLGTDPVYYSTHVEIPSESTNMLIDYLYGGCQKSNVLYSTLVEVKGGHIGNIFGGCNISGDVGSTKTYPAITDEHDEHYATVYGSTWVLLTGGNVYNNVFAGSNGFYHCNDDMKYIAGVDYDDPEHYYINTPTTIPTHNETRVRISGSVTVHGNVYAGGNLANVGLPNGYNSGMSDSDPRKLYPIISGWASVRMSGGTVKNNVYGGANMATIYGCNEVEISGGEIEGALYGGNDRSGRVSEIRSRTSPFTTASDGHTPTGNPPTYVLVKGTAKIGTVYGGGNGDYDYSGNNFQYCIPNNATVEDIKPIQRGTFVDININGGLSDAGGYIGTVYGGGDGVTVQGNITVLLNTVNTPYAYIDSPGEGDAPFDNVGTIFGGNNKGSFGGVADIILLKGQVNTVYGGCNAGQMTGGAGETPNTITYYRPEAPSVPNYIYEVGSYVRLRDEYNHAPIEAVVSNAVYGGCRLSDVTHNSLVLVEGGDHSEVRLFGGNDIGGTIHGTAYVIVNDDAEVKEIYGGGNGKYRYTENGDIYSGNTIVATGDYSRPVCNTTHVELVSGTCLGNVYAGGLAGDCGNTNLIVNGSTVLKGSLFGGGCGYTDSIGLCTYNSMHYGNVTGTATTELRKMESTGSEMAKVYAGGHNGDCANTNLTIFPTFEYHGIEELYGGCVASNVTGTVNVTINAVDDGSHYTVHTLYGGNDYSGRVNVTNLNINSGRFYNVFGAGNGDYNYNRDLANRGYGTYRLNELVGRNNLGVFVEITEANYTDFLETGDTRTWLQYLADAEEFERSNPGSGYLWDDDNHSVPATCFDVVPYSMVVNANFNGGYYENTVYGGGNMGLVGNRDMDPSVMDPEDDIDGRNANIGRITLNIHAPAEFQRHVFAGARGITDMTHTFFRGLPYTKGIDNTRPNVDGSGYVGKQLAYAQKIVNMDGGIIHFSLYGGSEAVDDGFPYECRGQSDVYYYGEDRLDSPDRGNRSAGHHNTTLRPSTIMNIVGGEVRKSVYGGGYQGNVYGSIYVNVGQEAVNTSPVWTKSYGRGSQLFTLSSFKPTFGDGMMLKKSAISLEASVYNGSDWGEASDKAYFNTRGVYGGETNILIDGYGYNTYIQNPGGGLDPWPSMNIAYSVIGAGTSTEGGDVNRLITMRNYGEYYSCNSLSKGFFSIQRADKVILDHVYVELSGEQDAFSAYTSPAYSLSRIDTLIFVDDNIINIGSPAIYVTNLVSLKAGGSFTDIHVAENLLTNTVVDGITVPTGVNDVVANDLLDNLHNNLAAGQNCSSEGVTVATACDGINMCDVLTINRGTEGEPSAHNTLIIDNGGYFKVAPFIDEDLNGRNDDDEDEGDVNPDKYGHVYGWMYLISSDDYQAYVYAIDKTSDSDPTHGSYDGGFISFCSCGNAIGIENELDYNNIQLTYNGTPGYVYRTWHIGKTERDRNRHITLIANAEPDNTLNYDMPVPDGGYYDYLYSDQTRTSGQANGFPIDAASGHDNFAYAYAYLELPPSQGGHFYVIDDVIVDQDNGNQMQLLDQSYDHASKVIFQSSNPADIALDLNSIANPTVGEENNRNYYFGLTLSTKHGGSHFNHTNNGNWINSESVQVAHTPDGDRDLFYYTDGDDGIPNTPDDILNYYNAWPTSIISGGTYLSQVRGFISEAVSPGEGVIPTMMFTLTYDKRLTTTISRDVLFILQEYDASGNYVGPVNVTVTISTVIKGFSTLEAPVLAMYNEGISNVYTRKVTIPAAFLQRDIYLQGISWDNTAAIDAGYPITSSTAMSELPGSCDYSVGAVADHFFLQPSNLPIGQTAISDGTRYDNGKTYCGNNLFSIIINPTESNSENVANHLGWYNIHTTDIDIYKAALDDYIVTTGKTEGWDFSNGTLAEYNMKRHYDSWNYTDVANGPMPEFQEDGHESETEEEFNARLAAWEAIEATKQKTKLSENGILLGTLDGRSTAGIDVTLKFNGDYVYNKHDDPELASITLHFFWRNTKYIDPQGISDRGYLDIVVHLKTRQEGDTIYVAPGNQLIRAVNGVPCTLNSIHHQPTHTPGVYEDRADPAVSVSHASLIKGHPECYVNNLKEALRVYTEGDVIAIMETVEITDGKEATTVHGDDYSIIQIIRYSGSHYRFPSLECALTGPMIWVKESGRLNLRNVWINGSGCTRTKPGVTGDSSSTHGAAILRGTQWFYEKYPRVNELLYSQAPAIYCTGKGTINMSSNVLITNNFNISGSKVWNAGTSTWDDPPTPQIPGGGIAVIRDRNALTPRKSRPNVIFGTRSRMYDNVVVDWKSTAVNNSGTYTVIPDGPLNYGGAVYIDGGKFQLGTSVSVTNNDVNISRNYYLLDNVAENAGISTREKHELGGGTSSFNVYYLDTLTRPQYFTLSNVYLTRKTSYALDFEPDSGAVRRDTLSDHITFISDLTETSRVGISKWFPGYIYNNVGHRLYNIRPRDTISVATDVSGKQRIATLNYNNNVFFNDSVYHYQSYPENPTPRYGEGSPHFVNTSNYVLYKDDQTNNPGHKDRVSVLYNVNVNEKNIYFHRCASFGTGVVQTPKSYTDAVTGRQVFYNDYTKGDSVYFHMNNEATCMASTDTVVFKVGGGFFPYTYRWYYDSILDDANHEVHLYRKQVRVHETVGSNSIAAILNSSGQESEYNARLRYNARRDTLVLRSLQHQPSIQRSTYFYYVTATDQSGECQASMPIMVRVAKSVVESNEDPEQKYYEDEVNFLRHRNPWAGYYHYSPEAEEGTCREHYYTEYPTYSGKLDGGDESHYSWAEDEAAGTWKRYTNRELEKDDGCNTPATWNDRMYATNLFFQKTETENATTYYVFTNPSTGGVYKSTQSNLSDDTDPGRPADWEDYVPMSGYLYYRVKVPGVDSSSFHDHVSYGMENSKMVFFNAKGEKLVPYIDFTQVGDEHSNPKSDTLRYYLVREVAGVEYNYRCQLGTNIEDLTLQERHWDAGAYTDWTAVDAHASDLPEEEDLFPDHKVPFHTYSSGDANDGGIRRAGYTHLPMQWFTHGYNHGTLMQRDSASAFLGRPYRDETKALTQAYYYNTPLSTDVGNRNNEMTEEFGSLYNNPMIPRYLRTYIAYKLNPTIHPDDAVPEASTNPVDVYMSSDVGLSSPLDLEVTEFCAGDIVQLRPNPNASSPNWNFMAWDFDASAEENATFVVEGNNLTPTAYYSPGDYWYQVVTSLPLPEEDNFVRHYNGSVTVKSKEGLAWLISVVNGYNGQNSHTFENDTVFIDFSGIGSHTVDMSEHKWTPLGNLNNPFKGVFMPLPETINTTTEEEFKASLPVINGIIVNENSVQRVGFFGYTYNAELRQFKVNDITLKGASYVGGITAHAVNTKIKNVYVGAEAKSKSVNLFGEQVIGGIVGKGESDTINSNAFNGYLRGHAIYAGSLLGEGLDCYGTGNGSGNSKVDVTGLVALYFGGLVGIVEDNDVTKTGGQSNFSNNYVSIVTGEYNYRIGGLVGRAENIDLRNNYVYGQAKGTIYTGGLVGYVGNNVEITNCYFVDGMTGNAWGYNTHPNSVRKWTTFFGSGNNVKMREPVDGYTNLTRALNRWVFAHGDSIYKTWRSALPGENHGYPVFGDPDIITVRDSVHTTVCDNIEWDGITFNESGRYIFHVVDSSDYLDSTFTLVLTVHHSDSTTFADSVTLGQGYNGYGLSLTADELQQLFGNDRTVEVVALRYVDSLLTAQGCDSLVVLTLYVVNDNVGVPQAQQQLIDVKVYPNPTLGSVNVEGSGLKSIEVYDNVSHRILSRNAASDHEQFDLSGYPSGNYFIRVRTAYGTVVKKLIKK